MINTSMRFFPYFTLGKKDQYGQLQIPDENSKPEGIIKMAINITSQSNQDNIRYQDATYMGLTHADVNDTYVIEYNGERLKVLYVNKMGRLNQVFMKNL